MSGQDAARKQEASEDKIQQVDRVPAMVFEDMLAARDSDQIFVSTTRHDITVKRVATEPGARQWGGQWSETTMQQLAARHRNSGESTQPTNIKPDDETAARYRGIYGTGRSTSDATK
ncbi:hypothetical protein BP6252_03952 [Coleophoma cylindrospora]|uniref:Uncharacterized protein n=1 Tax=Coleophoma cylindrospora TaxID=1849047 RepID=A0A3D8S9C6_9HELO|nr:hypothetical protein BP6252_03952 [Coleophoma cylindrospora]